MAEAMKGGRELQATLRRIGRTGARRILRSMVSAGLQVLVNAMKAEAPGRIKDEIGSSAQETAVGQVRGKAGIGVGRGHRPNGIGHLFAAGTKERFRKRLGGRYRNLRNPTAAQRSTGVGPPHAIVRRATQRARADAIRTMRRRGREAIERAIQQSKG